MESKKYKKQQRIKELKEGDVITGDIFVVKIKHPLKEYTKGFCFTLQLTDDSGGNITYNFWGGGVHEEVKKIYDTIKKDDVIFINGSVTSYNNKLQINASEKHTINSLCKDDYNEEDFIKKTKNNIDDLYNILIDKVNLIIDEKLRKFVFEVLDEKKEFKYHPAAISIHHNHIGGLLEHTLELISYCEISKINHVELDLDLLIACSIFHDIGKTEELEMTTRIKSSTKGMLLGHLCLGFAYIKNKLSSSDINEETKNKILHIILSHHGRLEYGSPKEPMIPEAVVIYFADELSCKLTNMLNYIEDSKDNTEDDFAYKYNYNKGDNIYLR